MKTAKPTKFDDKSKWEEWNPVFINFLRALLGRHNVSIKYIVKTNINPTIIPNADFIDDCINIAPFNAEAYLDKTIDDIDENLNYDM